MRKDSALFPYQEDGIRFLLSDSGTLRADEIGFGKTVQAIGLINTLEPDAQSPQLELAVAREAVIRRLAKKAVITAGLETTASAQLGISRTPVKGGIARLRHMIWDRVEKLWLTSPM